MPHTRVCRRRAAARGSALSLLLAVSVSAPGFAQDASVVRRISLAQAIDEALAHNARLAVAEARRRIAEQDSRKASGPLWPRLDVGAGYLRSNDPVAAFGTKLRQGRFGPTDLDFAVLNRPDPIDDWSGSVRVRWSLVDPTVWAGRAAAGRRAESAFWSAARTREATVLTTRALYYQVQAAAARLRAAESALEAARATVGLFRARRERGLLTEADVLQAEAEFSAAEARRLEAERATLDARQRLASQLGWGPDTLPEPSDELAQPAPPAGRRFDPAARADLRARAAAAAAAAAARARATAAYLPALDLFAEYAPHSGEPFASLSDNWTIGLGLRWTLFDGFGRAADRQRAKLEQRIARIEYEQALRDARAELTQANRAVESAAKQVEATSRAAEAAESARDLMRRRFNEGLATAVDLLQAESRAAALRQRAIGALARYHIALARLEFVRSQSSSAEAEGR